MNNDEDTPTGKDFRYLSALVEEVVSQNKAVLEIVGGMQSDMILLAKQVDLDEVKADIKTIKAAVTETNTQVRDHERRITKLEAA